MGIGGSEVFNDVESGFEDQVSGVYIPWDEDPCESEAMSGSARWMSTEPGDLRLFAQDGGWI